MPKFLACFPFFVVLFFFVFCFFFCLFWLFLVASNFCTFSNAATKNQVFHEHLFFSFVSFFSFLHFLSFFFFFFFGGVFGSFAALLVSFSACYFRRSWSLTCCFVLQGDPSSASTRAAMRQLQLRRSELDLLHTELTVEDIVHQNTFKVFRRKCSSFHPALPQEQHPASQTTSENL